MTAYWLLCIPLWLLLLIEVIMTMEERHKHDRYRQTQEACESAADESGTGTWPRYSQTTGKARTGPCPVDEELPIIAKRAARLLWRGSEVWWQAISNEATFGITAEATCPNLSLHGPGERAPVWGCTCGFYAVPNDATTQRYSGSVDLEVLLSGDVIIHEMGYRAQYQQVVSMEIPNCGICGVDAVVTVASRRNMINWWACSPEHMTLMVGTTNARISNMMMTTMSAAAMSMITAMEPIPGPINLIQVEDIIARSPVPVTRRPPGSRPW